MSPVLGASRHSTERAPIVVRWFPHALSFSPWCPSLRFRDPVTTWAMRPRRVEPCEPPFVMWPRCVRRPRPLDVHKTHPMWW